MKAKQSKPKLRKRAKFRNGEWLTVARFAGRVGRTEAEVRELIAGNHPSIPPRYRRRPDDYAIRAVAVQPFLAYWRNSAEQPHGGMP
jgi:hypothetical protein